MRTLASALFILMLGLLAVRAEAQVADVDAEVVATSFECRAYASQTEEGAVVPTLSISWTIEDYTGAAPSLPCTPPDAEFVATIVFDLPYAPGATSPGIRAWSHATADCGPGSSPSLPSPNLCRATHTPEPPVFLVPGQSSP